MSFSTMSEIMEASQSKNLPLWKVIMDDDVQERKVTEAESFSRMEKMLDAMIEADKKYNPDLRSQSGLSGGDGAKLETFRKNENRLIGTFLAMVMEKAVKMADLMKIPVLGLVENMSYFECPDCGKKHYLYGDSKVEEIAKKYDIQNIARIPINPKLSAAADKGMIELYEGDWLDDLTAALKEI